MRHRRISYMQFEEIWVQDLDHANPKPLDNNLPNLYSASVNKKIFVPDELEVDQQRGPSEFI
ncbi:MAG: hypothetical protein M0T74_14790 [Desulfitobacterium hafniense]|nr:hypothetical protein [Desulfitobacterium hafniense]